MASYDTQPVDNDILLVYDSYIDSLHSDDYSLLHEVDDLLPNGDISPVHFDLSNMHSTLNCSDPEVNCQLSKLISDNLSLKKALDRNNAMMKEQLSTIPAWRDLMKLKVEQQQLSLQEAKEKICSLEKENANLKQKLDDLLKQACLNRESREFSSKFCATMQTDEEPGYEIIHQQSDKDESVKNCLSLSSGINKKYEDLEEVLKQREGELELLKKDNDLLCEKLKVYDAKFQEIEKDSKIQFELLSNKLNYESSIAEKYRERCEILQQQIDEYQVKLEKAKMLDEHNAYELRQEIQNLQAILRMEQQSNQRDKEELSKVIKRCEILQVEHDRVSTLFEIQNRDSKEKAEKFEELKMTLEKRSLEIDHLTAQLLEAEEKLNDREAVIKELEEKFSYVAEEHENIQVLKAQIELYKKDFFACEARKESAVGEVKKLSEELRMYKEKAESSSRKSSLTPRRNGSFSTMPPENEEVTYKCPVCSNAFTSERAIQNHVHRCLDQ